MSEATPAVDDDMVIKALGVLRQQSVLNAYPYVADLILILWPYPSARRPFVLDQMQRSRKAAGLPIPSFDSTVQASLQFYCADSDVFKARKGAPAEALSSWPKGKHAGVWAVNRKTALGWICSHPDIVRMLRQWMESKGKGVGE